MHKLAKVIGRFATPTIVVGKGVLLDIVCEQSNYGKRRHH